MVGFDKLRHTYRSDLPYTRNILGETRRAIAKLPLSGICCVGRNWQISPRSSDPQPWKSSQCSFCAKHRCRRSGLRCHAQVWHLFRRGVTGESEVAKTPLCTTWRYTFARSRRDRTIGVAKGRACSSRFSFRKVASQLRRPGSAL